MKFTAYALLFVALTCSTLHAGVPPIISYQGVLKDASGTNTVADNSYVMRFRLYNSASNPVWEETQDVPVKDGIFNVFLGKDVPFSPTINFSEPYWLGVKVSANPELPLVKLASSAYSLHSQYTTFITPFLTVDGQPSPNIFTKEQSGNSDYTISLATSMKCNIMVFAESKSRGAGGWVGIQLLKDGSEIDRHLEPDASTSAQIITRFIHTQTLTSEDGTVTFSLRDFDGTGDYGVILRNRFTIFAMPTP